MIPPPIHNFLTTDLMPMLACVLAALCTGLLGNFLVLRRMSLMGDAISHAVLPGLVLAFIFTGSRATLPMLIGAGLTGLLTVGLVSLVRRLGRLDTGTAMGVVFSILFALGVVLIERAARQVDLDAECVLYGMAETLFWQSAPARWSDLISPASLAGIPRQVTTLLVMSVVAAAFIAIFFKELRLASFDTALAASLGFRPGLVNAALMAMVAASTVAAFEAVGSILVIAMLVCPAATARLLTDRLRSQLLVSAIVATLSGILGYILGAFGPHWLGHDRSVSVTGMMTVVAGILLFIAVIASPSHGLIARSLRRLALAITVAREDLLATLYRAEERDHQSAPADHAAPTSTLFSLARRQALKRGEITFHRVSRASDLRSADQPTASINTTTHHNLRLTDKGRDAARQIVRTHRLWESYLVTNLGLRTDHVHDTATRLEHLKDPAAARLTPRTTTSTDPHGSPIPPPSEPRA